MSRQTALWQYAMTATPKTGLEGRTRFRRSLATGPFAWLRNWAR